MTITKIALTLLTGIGAGCTSVPPGPLLSQAALPDCFTANYDKDRAIFTMKNETADAVNQQCLLTVQQRQDAASESQLSAGRYRIYLANGGGGGAGGTKETTTNFFWRGGGGGGGGGAGAMETQGTVDLEPGVYKLTLGAGGPGGAACMPGVGGGAGWVGSPSNMIRVATGEVLIGAAGADRYARPLTDDNNRIAGKMDGHGGSGPGQATGGQGALARAKDGSKIGAEPGSTQLMSGFTGEAGAAGKVAAGDMQSGAGGGGGATKVGSGGGGGGESPGQTENQPQRGMLGGGGGGGEGSKTECDPGARGGHGYVAFRKI